ncbi:MAG TPA: hypothetical protein VGQ29_15485 [Gemmatimonadales bacterium]|jgi:hypothetical protein|nr:hypothetical protein [Gemmatimonadales bacterium]
MIRPSIAVALLALLACRNDQIIISPPPCGRGALCALHITLVVTGQVRASSNPLSGANVRVTAHRDSCTGPEILLLPSPTDARTDSTGVYVARAEVSQSAASACVRVAYSDALYADTNGVALHAPPAVPETLHVNVTGP